MTKSLLGRAALGAFGVCAVLIAGVAIFQPYSGHGGSGWVWLAMLFFLLGVLLGLVYVVRRAFRSARSPLARASVASMGLGVLLMVYPAFLGVIHGPVPAWLVMAAFGLLALGIVLRRVDRVRGDGEGGRDERGE